MNITDEMVLAGAKAANPFAWEMDEGEHMLEDSARETTIEEVRAILTAALAATPAADIPPCPVCHNPYRLEGAERYWEARWRDEKAENDRLRSATTPAVGGEPVEWHWRTLDDEGKPTSKWFVVDGPLEEWDMHDNFCEYRPLYAAPPASPLRGSVNDCVLQIIKMSPADQFDLAFKVAENVGYVLASPPEQPKETP